MRRKLGKYYYVSDSSAQQESEGVTVKLGRDSRTNRSVIVKVFENSAFKTSAGARELVKFEIETMSRTSGHPHVVQLSDVLVSPSHLFVIMDKVHGGDLFDVVAAEGRISEGVARHYFGQLLSAVEHCHSRGVCHRDIKVMQGFGYDGPTADVWSLGVTLFVMLSGFLPFEASTTSLIFEKAQAGDFQFAADLSCSACSLLNGMLDPDPSKRYTIAQVRSHPWFAGPMRRSRTGIGAKMGGLRSPLTGCGDGCGGCGGGGFWEGGWGGGGGECFIHPGIESRSSSFSEDDGFACGSSVCGEYADVIDAFCGGGSRVGGGRRRGAGEIGEGMFVISPPRGGRTSFSEYSNMTAPAESSANTECTNKVNVCRGGGGSAGSRGCGNDSSRTFWFGRDGSPPKRLWATPKGEDGDGNNDSNGKEIDNDYENSAASRSSSRPNRGGRAGPDFVGQLPPPPTQPLELGSVGGLGIDVVVSGNSAGGDSFGDTKGVFSTPEKHKLGHGNGSDSSSQSLCSSDRSPKWHSMYESIERGTSPNSDLAEEDSPTGRYTEDDGPTWWDHLAMRREGGGQASCCLRGAQGSGRPVPRRKAHIRAKSGSLLGTPRDRKESGVHAVRWKSNPESEADQTSNGDENEGARRGGRGGGGPFFAPLCHQRPSAGTAGRIRTKSSGGPGGSPIRSSAAGAGGLPVHSSANGAIASACAAARTPAPPWISSPSPADAPVTAAATAPVPVLAPAGRSIATDGAPTAAPTAKMIPAAMPTAAVAAPLKVEVSIPDVDPHALAKKLMMALKAMDCGCRLLPPSRKRGRVRIKAYRSVTGSAAGSAIGSATGYVAGAGGSPPPPQDSEEGNGKSGATEGDMSRVFYRIGYKRRAAAAAATAITTDNRNATM
eukprot:jgi/Undpi1/4137/HiC_scaffold_16.g07504.m1